VSHQPRVRVQQLPDRGVDGDRDAQEHGGGDQDVRVEADGIKVSGSDVRFLEKNGEKWRVLL
jgi:hypothetical protein